jgi:hypothetical protein
LKSLHDAVRANNLDKVKAFIEKGADINGVDGDGNTPLMLAVIAGYIPIVRYFLKQPVDLNIRNKKNYIALSLSKAVDPAITKMLIIKHVTDASDVETSLEDDTPTLINKLITTLLYKSKRKAWAELDCYNLRHYINSLDPKFTGFTQQDFEAYIRKQESSFGEFYGSYLSDDSDSDDEQDYHQQAKLTQEKIKKQSKKYQDRGQLDKLFFKKKTGDRKCGDIRPVTEGSAVFDLKERTQIHLNKHEKRDKIARDLRHLNRYLASGETLEAAQAKVETRFYCAQYRGVTHLTSKWNQASRKAHRSEDENGQAQYSASVLKEAGIDIYKNYHEARQLIGQNKDSLEVRARTLKEVLLTLREPRPCTYDNYSYVNFAYLLQNLYTQDYDGFHSLLKQDPLLQAIFSNDANPFVSTGDVPYHALKYAYGIKPYKGHEDERLRPRWKRNGRAERPYSGVVYVSLHPLEDYDNDGPLHLVSLNRTAEIRLKSELNIIPERESCFPAYIPEGRVIHKHVAKYLSFSGSYKQIYASKYGIDETFYNKLCALLKKARPHSKEMTQFKKILGEWLCSYHEVRLIDIARKAAKAKGGVLVYKDINRGFSLVPPIDSVNRNMSAMTEEIKSPVKEKQQFRRKIASSTKNSVRIIGNEADLDAITDGISELTLSSSEDFSVSGEGNGKISIQLAMAVNALKEKRYLGLQQLLSRPELASQLNKTLSTYQLLNASLMHIAVLLKDPKAMQLLLSCPHLTIQSVDETTNGNFHGVCYFEQLSPLALAIINKADELIPVMLGSHRFNLKEVVSCVVNKDLLDNLIVEPSDEDDEDFLGFGWSCRESHAIARTRKISLLHLAAEHGTLEVVNQLLAAGAPFDIPNSEHQRALNVALSNQKYDIATALIRAGASFSSRVNAERYLTNIPWKYRSHVDNTDTTRQPRPDEIPEDIYQFLIAMKHRFSIMDNDSDRFTPAFTFFSPARCQTGRSMRGAVKAAAEPRPQV